MIRSGNWGTTLFMTAALLFAGLAGLLLSNLLKQRYPNEPLQPIVVASQNIAAGVPLQASHLRMVDWPRSSIPQGVFGSVDQLLNYNAVSLVPLVAGQPVLGSHLSRPKSGIGVAAKLKPGERAIAIELGNGVTLAELPYPGARVDLLATFKGGAWNSGLGARTKTLLQNITVLAVGPEIDAASVVAARQMERSRGGLVSGTEGEKRRVVTVAVTAKQAEKLILALREGQVDMILRSPRDNVEVATTGATAQLILRSQARKQTKADSSTKQAKQQTEDPQQLNRRKTQRHRSTFVYVGQADD